MASFAEPLPGFEDLEPIPQDDGPKPVVPIAYSPDCTFRCTHPACTWAVTSGLLVYVLVYVRGSPLPVTSCTVLPV